MCICLPSLPPSRPHSLFPLPSLPPSLPPSLSGMFGAFAHACWHLLVRALAGDAAERRKAQHQQRGKPSLSPGTLRVAQCLVHMCSKERQGGGGRSRAAPAPFHRAPIMHLSPSPLTPPPSPARFWQRARSTPTAAATRSDFSDPFGSSGFGDFGVAGL